MPANWIYAWDTAKWDDGRWARYSATWDNGVWDESFWNLVWVDNFSDLIKQMAKVNIGTYVFRAGCVEPGVDNVGVPLRMILDKMER